MMMRGKELLATDRLSQLAGKERYGVAIWKYIHDSFICDIIPSYVT